MNSWQDLVNNYRPTGPTANENASPFWNRFNNGGRIAPLRPLEAYDSVKGVGNPLNRQLTPAEMAGGYPGDAPGAMPGAVNTNRNPWPFQRYGGPTGSPQYEMPRFDPNFTSAAAQLAMRFLPPPVQGALAAGSAIMAPTPTAPPSMDEAPSWSWPQQ